MKTPPEICNETQTPWLGKWVEMLGLDALEAHRSLAWSILWWGRGRGGNVWFGWSATLQAPGSGICIPSWAASAAQPACLLLININRTQLGDLTPCLGWAVSGIWTSVRCLGLTVMRKEWVEASHKSSLAFLAIRLLPQAGWNTWLAFTMERWGGLHVKFCQPSHFPDNFLSCNLFAVDQINYCTMSYQLLRAKLLNEETWRWTFAQRNEWRK